MKRRLYGIAAGCLSMFAAVTANGGGGGGWVTFTDATAERLLAAPALGIDDPDEKDYAWGDVDNDGDIDVVCVRKQPFTTPGRRPNVLFMNEGVAEGHALNGVLVDRTAIYAAFGDDGGAGFLDLTNDRDVVLADVDNDGWLDIVTATTLGDGLAKTISHPRIYMNQGEVGGVWQGFVYEEARIPQMLTIPGGLAVAPRFCSVIAADVTGDGFVDLYFGDYDSSGVGGGNPEAPGDDVNDRLLVNDGTGFFIDSLESRMTGEMLLSAFSMAAAFEDMNGDGTLDVVKDTALNDPRRVSISYNDPSSVGDFNQFDIVYSNSPYHIAVGDLNQDSRLDIIVTDDGQDRYLINQGNGPDGAADFVSFPFLRFTGSDGEFGGNNLIVDLNNDGHNDVIIADIDVDIQGCSRRMHIYRNLGDLPNVTLQEQEGAQPWTPNGVHDVATIDFNGDGWMDLLIGNCTGTRVFLNVPPADLVFTYPDGIPARLTPDTPTLFRVSVTGAGLTPMPGTGRQYVSIDGGAFVETAMVEDVANTYFVNLPSVPCTSTMRFYVSVETTLSDVLTDPPNAPVGTYNAISALGNVTALDDRFETAVAGWTVTNDASLTSGAWERVDPIGTFFPDGSMNPAQPEDDFGAASGETMCFVTQQHPGAGGSNASDVDGGPTVLTSPVIDLDGTDALISYARWQFSSVGGGSTPDALVTEVSNDGTNWVLVSATLDTGGEWEAASFKVSDFVVPTATVQVRFISSDNPSDSITESGIDNFFVNKFICMGDCITDSDCDDGQFCNGVERCEDGVCLPAIIGVENGTFDDGAGWNIVTPGGGAVTFNGRLNVVGTNAGAGSFAFASQGPVDFAGGVEVLEFDLISYTPTNTGTWDYPVLYIDGTFYGLNADGTLGVGHTTAAQAASGTINNGAPWPVGNGPLHFAIEVDELAGFGLHEIGLGVASVDGQFGAGTAVFDDVLPVAAPAGVCPGGCLSDEECDDGLYCNGIERCINGVCVAGTPPCDGSPGCDEVLDVCLGCGSDSECDDGLFCNGVERCFNGICLPAIIGVENGTFATSDFWTDNIPVDGAIAYAGQLTVTGANGGTGGFAWSSQEPVDFANSVALLEFDLLSYTPTDVDDWDYPVIVIDGTFYGLNDDGTLGAATTGDQAGSGSINNGNPTAVTIHFVVDVDALAGPGLHTIGFGVNSVDGAQGAGEAVFGNVLPAAFPAEPCPGQMCSDELGMCVDCLTDADCDDGLYCNGQEICVNGTCVPGVPPCPTEDCNELDDNCVVRIQPWIGQPVAGLTQAEFDRFVAGRADFEHSFSQPEGLGPIFNQTSCGSCHNRGGIGGAGSITVTRFGFAGKGFFDPLEEFGGSLLQAQALSEECREVIPASANVTASRITLPIFGDGLIEAIADADILAHAAVPPPGISGVPHMVTSFEDGMGGPLHVGRFGWKAQLASVLSFSSDAALNEMGLTNRFLPDENDPNGIEAPNLGAPDFCDTVADPEDGPDGAGRHFIDRTSDFQRFLAAPPQTPRSGMTGEALFIAVGCTDCHTRAYVTGAAPELALSARVIKPYSDFLLHDMGSLGDGIEQGGAATTEMRTPPLWGMRIRDALVHDGRVSGGTLQQRINQVVLLHGASGSEAAASAAAYAALTTPEKAQLAAFIDSLGRREFDHDGDNDVDDSDLAAFTSCFTGSGSFYTPDDSCSISDIDQDGDVDAVDFEFFLMVYQGGTSADCNGNLQPDSLDIAFGASLDCNLNGVPDECDPESSDVALFVAQLLSSSQDPVLVCMMDQNGDNVLDGDDVAPFVASLLVP